MLKEDTVKSYVDWSKTMGECYCQSHFETKINDLGQSVIVPKDDEKVCERERKWRVYYRLRDADLLRAGFVPRKKITEKPYFKNYDIENVKN